MRRFAKLWGLWFLVCLIPSILWVYLSYDSSLTSLLLEFDFIFLVGALSIVPSLIIAGLYYLRYILILKIIFVLANLGLLFVLVTGSLMSGGANAGRDFLLALVGIIIIDVIIYWIHTDIISKIDRSE